MAIREVILSEVEGNLLFDLAEVQYNYFCYVSNMGLSPMASHRYYGRRATSENWIEWCKNHMASGRDEAGLKEEPNAIRLWLISVPARLITCSRRWHLKLSTNYPFKQRWLHLENSLQELSFT